MSTIAKLMMASGMAAGAATFAALAAMVWIELTAAIDVAKILSLL